MNKNMLAALRANAQTGADLSPGDPVAAWAVQRIEQLEQELKDLRELLPRPDQEALTVAPVLQGKNALVLYFGSDQGRAEFAELIVQMMDVRTVRL